MAGMYLHYLVIYGYIIFNSFSVIITADGASILKSLKVSDPFAQLLVQVRK